ncbi:MAG: D-alanyl-D-alanine dipeptidase [Legionellales bacterium]|nr:D-alanyl-D-alanine dipeptidase [Legionellales bacterium]|tara:strand:+ start:1080 stop:1781 length:702 start_codon:yes stop_codon:yes gene_type:complete
MSSIGLKIAAPEVLDIPIVESGEKLVDMRQNPFILTDNRYHVACLNTYSEEHGYVRETVAKMLEAAQLKMPNGWQLKLIEGFRSSRLQSLLFDTVFKYQAESQPELTEDQIFDRCLEMVSPIINADGSNNVPPHCTGAAVDIKVFDKNGIEVNLGQFPEEDLSLPPESFRTYSKTVPEEQQFNRALLCELMESVGFVNYPYEWWHFSYGDRYWAYSKQIPKALYSAQHERNEG